MPKKKGKKSGDRHAEMKKTPEKQSPSTPADESKEKDFYRTLVRHLDEQLERYQQKCDQLEGQKKDLNSQYSALETEKKDIVDYLKRSLLEKEDEVDTLTEQLQSQRQAARGDREALQLQHGQLRRELQERIEELDAENTRLAARLAGLEEFQKQREQLTANMESLEKQLASQQEEHKVAIHNLEMKALMEKKRLEEKKESYMQAAMAEVQDRMDQKIPETTRSALQQNTEFKAQLSRLLEQTQGLMKENLTLRDRKSWLSVNVDNQEQMLSEMARESCISKRVVGQLTKKLQQLQAELEVWRRELEQLQTKHAGVLAEMEALRRERASLSEQCSKNGGEASRLQAELQEERRRRSRMKSIMQEAAVALRQALMDAPTDQDPEVNVQWRQLMEKLLVVLDRPKLNNSTAESERLDELQTSDSEAAGTVTLNGATSFQFELARYRPGDLGFVPCPAPKHKRIPCSSHVPLHRNPSGQKTATSMNRTDSAVRRFPKLIQ